jgi:hypothetical protein
MKFNVMVELDDYEMFNRGETSPEDILVPEIKRAIIHEVAQQFGDKHIKEIAEKMSLAAIEKVESLMKEKVNSFMGEEIALTDRWGNVEFVGTVEDLMKQKFDETILAPVDSSGKKLQGCTSSSKNYVQWHIENETKNYRARAIQDAETRINTFIKNEIKQYLDNHVKDKIKHDVSVALGALLGT